MDLIVGTDSYKIALYSGSDSGDSVPLLSSEGYLQSNGTPISITEPSPCTYDYDRDGIDDLLVGSGGGKIYVFINTGTQGNYSYDNGYFPLENENGVVDLGFDAVPQAVDLNGDMQEDLVVGYFISEEGHTAFLEGNQAGGMFNFAPPVDLCSYWGDSTITFGSTMYPFAGDINSDGSVDLVSGEYFGEMFLFMGEPGTGTCADSSLPVQKPVFTVLSNPVTQNTLHIQVDATGSSYLALFDCSGRKISENPVDNGFVTVDMQDLPFGIYTVLLTSSRGVSSQRVTLLE
ncbi:MAG: T9SS type A sorting domain-containing protein [Candidatus Sabulitectum sp.]|nr:T9SS type A sorting domain-containing protein [Candidatus Sabulitectum sp.]